MTSSAPDLPERAEEMICFAVYAASHAMTRAYQPMLKPLGLTYPQYLVLTVLWADDIQTVGALGGRLGIESNTLTPLLKRLEATGHVKRRRGEDDERRVFVSLTSQGATLKEKAPEITRRIIESTGMGLDDLTQLVETLSRMKQSLTPTDRI
ncbi:MAG: MarR family winged helix-turn-helix transcriptional regulator [Paracoccaceae bacterium]|jgi:MarR family transcriptional regulator, organic hydroperoxide resistance regulator|nr:MarR family winged helix-turn-helix transcriptional regulator [Paracoccaceae bacterium]MDG1369293.1 MarR family winged helix-turn-helix transcriptional regulator [Paracoccaceae bacterium]